MRALTPNKRDIYGTRLQWVLVWTTASILLTIGGVGSSRGVSSADAAAGTGYRDFSFAAAGVGTPTGEKPQSKLWFNDGSWWGVMFDRAAEEYHIYRYDKAAHQWNDTGTVVDERNNSKADALWDGGKLYVASAGPSRANSADSGRFLRYSYDPVSESYSRDPGFPETITPGGTEAITVERDTTGQFWATYTRGGRVYVNHSSDASGQSWGTPSVVPVAGADNLSADDISSVIAFDQKIGVMWSNQNDDAMYFATHNDGAADDVWQSQAANDGPGIADDHINLKSLQADPAGRVFAVVKTSLGDGANPDRDAPQVLLMVRGLNGEWSNHTFGRVRDRHTRPIAVVDRESRDLYVFATAPVGGGTIYYKKTSLSDVSFAEGRGTPFIESSTDPQIDDATSTKQSVNSQTGLLVLASDSDSTDFYLHNFMDLSTAADTSPPETTIDSGPSGIVNASSAEFTFSSSDRGSEYRCSLDDAAFVECSSPRRYTELTDGDHIFRVQATDVTGNTDPTPASRTWTVGTREPSVDTHKPTIRFVYPGPGDSIKSRTPKIRATVEDDLTNLSKKNIRLIVAGEEIAKESFAYNRSTDRLVYASPRLSPGEKRVRVVAEDAAGNSKSRSWYFTVDTREPTVSRVSPRPGARLGDRTPRIRATIKDDLTNLSERDIRLVVAGREMPERRFTYNRRTNRLSHNSRRLPPGRRYVKILVRDAAGNEEVKLWRFRINERR